MELIDSKKYKKTDVGMIPIDWEIKELNDISKITRLAGYEYSTVWQETLEGEITALRGFNIGKNKIIEREFVKISNELSMKLIRSRLFKGDVVYPCVGSIGNAVVIEEDDKYHIQQNIAKITPVKHKLDSTFLAHYLMSSLGLKEIERFNGSSSQPNILVGSLRKYVIQLPTLAEQTLIANALSDADALISSLEKLITKKKLIKQGAMQQLLKPKKGWEVKKLGEVGVIVTGSTPPTHLKEYWNGFIPWITPTDISNNQKNIYHSEREISVLGLEMIRKLPANTLLVTCIASIGKNAILRNNGACNQQINAIIPNANHNVDFLYYLIENNKKYLLGNAGITATLMISKKDFSEITFSFPTIGEQNQIATILSEMDTEIASLETKLDKYRKIKQGMMQNLLTGKIRLQ